MMERDRERDRERNVGTQQQSLINNKKKKGCPFTASKMKIDYKDIENLSQFITERGKILPRRITGVSCYHQRLLKVAIKRARHMALLPFVAEE
ncbi:MAG: 30S ribosomal protein S18 [Chlamydiota bacterium]